MLISQNKMVTTKLLNLMIYWRADYADRYSMQLDRYMDSFQIFSLMGPETVNFFKRGEI